MIPECLSSISCYVKHFIFQIFLLACIFLMKMFPLVFKWKLPAVIERAINVTSSQNNSFLWKMLMWIYLQHKVRTMKPCRISHRVWDLIINYCYIYKSTYFFTITHHLLDLQRIGLCFLNRNSVMADSNKWKGEHIPMDLIEINALSGILQKNAVHLLGHEKYFFLLTTFLSFLLNDLLQLEIM